MIIRATHNPTSVSAVQFTERDGSAGELIRLASSAKSSIKFFVRPGTATLRRKDGNEYFFRYGDWLIKHDTGCIYTCTEEAFKRNYSI